jgi:hypothetical protein
LASGIGLMVGGFKVQDGKRLHANFLDPLIDIQETTDLGHW